MNEESQNTQSGDGDYYVSIVMECIALERQILHWREKLYDYQRRVEKDIARAEEQILRPHIISLLPTLDALDEAKKHKDENESSRQEAVKMIVESLSQCVAALRSSPPQGFS